MSRAAENMCYLISTNVAGGIGFSVGGVEQGGCSQIVDFHGSRLVYAQDPGETIEASAMIDIEALRAARRDTGMGNMLLRSRWEMYRDYFARAEFYPANGLAERAFESYPELRPLIDRAVANLTRTGVIR